MGALVFFDNHSDVTYSLQLAGIRFISNRVLTQSPCTNRLVPNFSYYCYNTETSPFKKENLYNPLSSDWQTNKVTDVNAKFLI